MINGCIPKYADKWDSHNFVFHCPDPNNDPLEVNKVMNAMDATPTKIYRVLNGQDEQIEVPGFGTFNMAAAASNMKQLAEKIDDLLGEGYICVVPANIVIDATNRVLLRLKFHSSIDKVDIPHEPKVYQKYLKDLTKIAPFVDIDKDNPFIGEAEIQLTTIKV